MHIKAVLLTSPLFHKLAALSVAFFLWSMLSDLYAISKTYSVPVAVRVPSTLSITQKPDHVDITVRGLRKYVRAIDPKNLSVLIDPKQLSEGPNHITITAAMLGLPSTISVVDYKPINLTIVAQHSGGEQQNPAQDASVASDLAQQPT